MPHEPYWDKWADPQDEGRWVAVLYWGSSPSDEMYRAFLHGF